VTAPWPIPRIARIAPIALRIARVVLAGAALAAAACTHAPPGADGAHGADAGASACDDYAQVLSACRGSGPNGAIALEAQAALADQLARAPGGRAPLEARCRQLSTMLHADPTCEAALASRAPR
jgi:hypothetical protein